MLPREDKQTRLKNQIKSNTKALNSFIGKDTKKSIQLPEKILIDCQQETDTLNTSIKSQRSAKEIKLFHLLNNESDSSDEANDHFNLMAQQQKEYQFFQLDAFLKSISLSNLFQLFIKNKVTDSLSINTLTDDKLIAMKITKENRKKILNEVNRSFKENEANEMGIQSNCVDKEDAIVDFEENERIQAELFKKAVEEFRRGGKDYVPSKEESADTETDRGDVPKVENPKKFLMNLGGKDLFSLNSISLFQDEGNDIKDDAEYLAELAIGRACWSCFKKITEAYPKKIDEKYFCTQCCLQSYQRANEVKCSFCNKNYYKNNGMYHRQNHFCSIDCFEKDKNKIIENQNEEEDNDDEYDNENIKDDKAIRNGLQLRYGNNSNDDFDILDI